jgi:hypothetical protein
MLNPDRIVLFKVLVSVGLLRLPRELSPLEQDDAVKV